MKKVFFLIIPFVLPAIALILWLQYDRRQVPTWQVELEKYIVYQERNTSMRIAQQAVVRASKPWEFIRDSNFVVYGDTPYYDTDNAYGLEPKKDFNRMPLPYPPEEIWCALLRLEPVYGPDSPKLKMVLVARHQDMYNASWVIHAANQPPSSAKLSQIIYHIGCDIAVPKIEFKFLTDL